MFRETFRQVIAEWNASVNGSLFTTLFVVLTAVFGLATVLTPVFSKNAATFPNWPAVAALSCTLLFVFVSLPYAALSVADKERLARSEAEDRSKPRLKVRIERLVVHAPNGQLGRQPQLVALLSVSNDGYDTVARKWEMLIGEVGSERGVTKVDISGLVAVSIALVQDWSRTPPAGLISKIYDEHADVSTLATRKITRGDNPEVVFVGHLPYDDISMDELKTIRTRCEDFLGISVFSSLPEGNLELGFIDVDSPARFGLT